MNELEKILYDTSLSLEGKLVYKKLKGRYRIFCMKCRRYEYVSPKEFKQIQAAHICPMCFREVKPSTVLEQELLNYIVDKNNDGYRVVVKFKFGCKPRIKYEHVMRYKGGNYVEVRLIQCNMGWSFGYRPDLKEWRQRHAQGYFYRFCTSRDTWEDEKPMTKRDYIYKALGEQGLSTKDADAIKSNQRKIFQDNLLNGKQMEFVIAFDLKSYEEMYKYRAYIKDRNNTPNFEKVLNVHYLDYLYRNKIRLRDFYDYKRDCEALGFKLDKPKDFQFRHVTTAQSAAEKRRKKTEEGAKKRYESLKKKEYRKGSVEIKAFKNADEIRKCGKALHNCIGTYVKSYAESDTDLFYLTVKGKVTVAIERKKNRLIQARADHNGKCPPNLMRHINRWMEAS